MTQELIETFLLLNEYRNTTTVSQKMYTSQSSISHRLKLLEEELGVSLFIRSKGQRTMELTAQGEEFIPIAQRWMSLLKDTQNLQKQPIRNVLTIGSVHQINSSTFVPLYQQHLQKHPDVRLNILTHHSSEIYDLLESRNIDVGYVFSRMRYPDILSVPVYRELLYLVCHKDSPYYDGIHPEELPVSQEVYLRWGADFELWHDRYWRSTDCLLCVNTGINQISYLNVPGRWAIVPRSIIDALNDSNIVRYTLSEPIPPMICCQITNRYPKPGHAALIASFTEEVRKYIAETPSICAYEPWMEEKENRV